MPYALYNSGRTEICQCCAFNATTVSTIVSVSGRSDFASQKFYICAVTHIAKSACPTAAKKHLPPHSATPQSTPPTPFPRQPEAKVLHTRPSYRKSCANRDASHPDWKPRTKELRPAGHSHIFLENGTQTVKMQFATIPQKILNRCNLHPCEDENCSGLLLYSLIRVYRFPLPTSVPLKYVVPFTS